MFNCRWTMMTFVECVDLAEASTRCQRTQQTPYGFTKKFSIKLTLKYSLTVPIVSLLWLKLLARTRQERIIRRANIWRNDRMIQFDEVTFSNSRVNNIALVNGDIVIKKQHYSTSTFVHNGTADDWCLIGTTDRSSTWQIFAEKNSRFVPENDLFKWPCSTKSSCCFFSCLLAELGFLFTEAIVTQWKIFQKQTLKNAFEKMKRLFLTKENLPKIMKSLRKCNDEEHILLLFKCFPFVFEGFLFFEISSMYGHVVDHHRINR